MSDSKFLYIVYEKNTDIVKDEERSIEYITTEYKSLSKQYIGKTIQICVNDCIYNKNECYLSIVEYTQDSNNKQVNGLHYIVGIFETAYKACEEAQKIYLSTCCDNKDLPWLIHERCHVSMAKVICLEIE